MICIPHTNGTTTLIPTPHVNSGAPSTSHTIKESTGCLSLGVGGSIMYIVVAGIICGVALWLIARLIIKYYDDLIKEYDNKRRLYDDDDSSLMPRLSKEEKDFVNKYYGEIREIKRAYNSLTDEEKKAIDLRKVISAKKDCDRLWSGMSEAFKKHYLTFDRNNLALDEYEMEINRKALEYPHKLKCPNLCHFENYEEYENYINKEWEERCEINRAYCSLTKEEDRALMSGKAVSVKTESGEVKKLGWIPMEGFMKLGWVK